MGMYNTYGNSQLKADTRLTLAEYSIGDKTSLPDGIYCGSDGFIVINEGHFIAEIDNLYDNFGENPKTTDQMEQLNG